MIEIRLPASEQFDPETGELFPEDATVLRLEHSLAAVAEWEAKWKKPFLSRLTTAAELLDYFRCMSGGTADERTIMRLTRGDAERIVAYMNEPMTATTFSDRGGGRRQKLTNEVIYALMAKYGVPFDCDKWHLNRLLTLLRVCAVQEAGPKKMSQREAMERQIALNEARRKKNGSRG